MPGLGDVKVHTERLGPVVHVFVDAASRVEVSARDIRSRIAAQAATTSDGRARSMSSTSSDDGNDPKTRRASIRSLIVATNKAAQDKLTQPRILDVPEVKRPIIDQKTVVVYCTVLCSQVTLVLQDDQKVDQDVTEVLRFILSNVVLSARPRLNTAEKLRALYYQVRQQLELRLFVGDAQIDNQLFAGGKYDFPVIFLFQSGSSLPAFSPLLPIERLVQMSQNDSKFRLLMVLEKTPFHKLHYQAIDIKLLPVKIYAEDVFFYALIDILQSFVLSKVPDCASHDRRGDDDLLPVADEIISRSCAVTHPLSVQELTIDAVTAELSVHASVKLYIALDHSPLQFAPYRRSQVMTTSYSLGHNLAMHYISGTLVRAGWVLGSLEILGNPGGFARTLGSGVKDFVQLPYEGILLGPWAFVSGITHGSLSLMKHFTAGMENIYLD